VNVPLVVAVILTGVTATPARDPALSGSYRATLSAGDLVRAGAPSVEAADDSGTWTLTVLERRWTLHQTHAPDQNGLDRGVVTVAGNRVGFTLLTSDGAPHRVFLGTFRWTSRAGTLRFSLLADQFPTGVVTVLTARPWTRIR
jgi:hypothetical protein